MRRMIQTGITTLGAGLILMVGGTAVTAATPAAMPAAVAPASVPATTTTTLPLFGAPLVIDISSGPGGALTDVAVNPADGLTATKVRPNKVRFVNEDGTARLDIVSKHGGQKVAARAGALTDLTGPGGWSGDIFGTGVTTTVGFEIVALADGTPDITAITTSDPTAQIGEVKYRSGDDDDDDESSASASVGILFTNGTQARTLRINVEVHTEDGETRAKTQVGLSKLSGVELPADQVVGPQSWSGVLCDGSTASVDYIVDADGNITDATASPDGAEVSVDDGRLRVDFGDRQGVRIRVRTDDGLMRISVDERIRCESADPTVNTPISEPDADDESRDESRDDDRNRDGDNDRNRGDDDGDGNDGRDGDGDDDGGGRGGD